MKLSEAVSLFLQMKDKKAKMKAEFDASLKPLQEKMDKLEAKLLDVFNKTGMELVRTEYGTVFPGVRKTASVADRDTFMDFVKENQVWSLIEVRVSPTGVDEYRAANDDELPPGVNVREERVVNYRRSK